MSFVGNLEKWGMKVRAGNIQIEGLIPARIGKGNIFFVDPANGSDNNSGKTPELALASVAAAYAKTTDANNDVIYFIPGATADNPTASITWSKSYTHLIGLSGNLPGMGQRCRIVNTTTNDLVTLMTISGSGCIFKNIQWFDGKDAAADGANVLVSGSRNSFENCFFAGMGNDTASGPFSRAGSYSLKVSGAENNFIRCTIGLDTVARTAANCELYLSGVRNTFEGCMILSNSTTAGKFLVKVDNAAGDLRWNLFKGCVFYNYTTNWATGITNAFDMPAGGDTHSILVQNCMLAGVGTGWADTVTHLYSSDPAPNAGFGIAAAPTT